MSSVSGTSEPRPLAVVFDDCATLALQLTRALEALGFAVQVCDPALMKVPLQPEPALICVELLGNNSNAFKLLRVLAMHHACSRVLVSASGRSTDHNWGRRAGATAVLTRPFTVRQLQLSARLSARLSAQLGAGQSCTVQELVP